MEGRKENKYNLSGICPECGKLLKVELVVATELVEHTTTEKVKEELDAIKGKAEGTGSDTAEGDSVRPDPKEGEPGTTSSSFKSADSGKSKRAKKTGGR